MDLLGMSIPLRRKLQALIRVAEFKPKFSAMILVFSMFSALLEGIGISFILPVISQIQSDGSDGGSKFTRVFTDFYEFFGIPYNLETIILGVGVVLTVRYTGSFLVSWLQGRLRKEYTRDLRFRVFERVLDARTEFFDKYGSDDIINVLVTQYGYAGNVIKSCIQFVEESFLMFVYASLAFYIAPKVTVGVIVLLGGFSFVFQKVIESAYNVGDEIAGGNEEIQRATQAGIQGIRDIRLFGLESEIESNFRTSVTQVTDAGIRYRKNKGALNNFYNLATAMLVFVLLYVIIQFTSLTLAEMGVFLFAMFRLAPRASGLNNKLYAIENNLPHLVRTQDFMDMVEDYEVEVAGERSVPPTIETIEYDDVSFSYDDEQVLNEVSLTIERGEFVSFVGQSGAGKSTITSLLAKLYKPDEGEIRANSIDINEFDTVEWRSKIAFVRQKPYIFDDTLERNLTVGNRNASQTEIRDAANAARITEFIDELPDGYDTELGEEGVRLSGGQRQRIAIARALLKDSQILVLDEATSEMDSKLETQVHTAIEERFSSEDRILIAVAHNLSTIENADRVFAMADGQIMETGSHQKLLENEGEYARLYNAQTQSNATEPAN